MKRKLYLDNGQPRYIRCYDNGGKSFDRYTVVFTGRYTRRTGGVFWYVGMSALPFSPQGFGQHGESARPVDVPTYSHLGKCIDFSLLPADCQKLVRQDYEYLWGATP